MPGAKLRLTATRKLPKKGPRFEAGGLDVPESHWFQICCVTENGTLISNRIDETSLKALQMLIQKISSRTADPNLDSFFLRRNISIGTARELYAWRDVIDEIKAADLVEQFSDSKENVNLVRAMTDKPLMLKIAGEITNAVMHSYDSRHEISLKASQRLPQP